ncbi:MAG: GC-type dockerin domain-anchored protein [Phycisphaerales bacterium]|nr:GC-type dockerin domain-anchored protein [Phycisphaerales bacterium]
MIREILSTGEIMYDIEAGNGVWVVRQATAENDPIGGGSALAYNVDDTKHGMKSKVVANLFTPGYLSNKSPGKGAIRLIEVVGPVTRSIIADNVNWDAPNEPSFEQAFVPSPLFHRRHRGILVWNGGIDGSVDIRYNLEQADIIAAGLKGGVTIGLSARGSVVAYGDPEDPIYKGIILFLQIGYIPDYSLTDPLHASEYPRDLLPPAYAGYSRGLRGSAVPPIYMTDPYGQANWKSPRSSTNPTGPMVFDGGAADCVVRFTATDPMGAGGATPAYIYNMHQYNPKPVSPPGNPAWRANPYRPRVEAPLAVGEFIAGSPWFSFVFGHWPSSSPDGPVFGGVPDGGGIESGVVWSGRVGSSVAHWFGLANSVMARAIGSNADVWLDTTAPDGTGRCAIDGDMNGRLHLHGLPSSRSVLIGERLGTLNDVGFLDTLHDHAVTTPVLTLENSPRGTHGLDEWPAGAGAVQVLNDAFGEEPFWLPGLDGQIVIDRWNTTGVQREGSHCAGSVLVADTTTSYGGTLLEPGSFYGSDYFLARYDLHAGPPTSPSDETLGTDNNGGAVGLAPYAMHAEDSLPSNRRGWGLTTPPVLIAELPNLVDPSDPVVYYNRLRTRFYGPILSQADGGGAGLRVQFEPAGSYAGFAGTPEDVTDEWEVTFPVFAPFPRDIMLQPRCDQSYRPGFYRVVRAQDVPVPPEGTPPTDRLRSDLTNTTGAYNTTYPPDMQPVAEFAHYFRLCDCGQADIGITGGVPGEDCVLDNNDFIVFIDYYFTNNPIADVGSTGGVPGPDGQWDNNDFIVYIDLFFAGCAGKFYGACEPGMRMAGRAASGESRDVADEAGRLAGIQASIRSLLTAAAERMPQSDRARIMGLLQSGRELTRDDLLGALDAMFAPQQESR